MKGYLWPAKSFLDVESEQEGGERGMSVSILHNTIKAS